MITCQQARQLFDRYLDGDLSESLQAELYAHVLHCSPCQARLAVLETCGDVIRMDRCESAVGPDFTDRVMAACRDDLAKRSVTRRKRRLVRLPARRVAWYGAGSLAAAASIALFLTLATPAGSWLGLAGPKTVTAGKREAAPKSFRENMTALTGRDLNPQEQAELDRTPEVDAAPFLEAFLKPVVEGTQNAVHGTRRSYRDIELLLRHGFAGMTDRLVAEYHEEHLQAVRQRDPDASRVISDLDLLDNALLGEEPKTQQLPVPMAAPSDSRDESRGAVPKDAI
jgi:hypothetical protein